MYASKWAVSASLLLEYDGVYWPVTFSSLTLKPNEVNRDGGERTVGSPPDARYLLYYASIP